MVEGAAIVTVANEPVVPETVDGLKVIDAGWFCGAIASCDCTWLPFHAAVMLAKVLAATWLVGIATDTTELPSRTVATAGAIAAEESLVRLMDTPPAGACPLSVISALAVAPPMIVPGLIWIDLIEGGSTVRFKLAVPELSCAVTVTGVAVVT